MSNIIHGLSAADYHARKEVSNSDLALFARSPAHYIARTLHPTKAMTFGTAFHCALLEPKRFEKDYAICPDFGDCRKASNKEAKILWLETNIDKVTITAEEVETIIRMTGSALVHDAAAKWIDDVEFTEVSIIAENECVAVRSRLDGLTSGRNIVDVKTTDDASPAAFAKSVWNYRYHVQNAFYVDNARRAGIDVDRMVFIAIEKDPPFAVAVYELDMASVGLGRKTYKRQLAEFAECQRFNHWPAYSSRVQTLSLPEWAFRK
jgi:hypothetical protein